MTKKELRLEFVSYCGKTGIGSVLMMNELFLAFDWFYSKLETAEREAYRNGYIKGAYDQAHGKYNYDPKASIK